MFFSREGRAEPGRRACPPTNRLPPGGDYQNGDGEKIGKHSQDVRRNEGKLPGLEVKLEGIDPPEEQPPEASPPWIPQGKDDHRNRNPPLTRRHILFPPRGIGKGEI